MNKLLSSYNRRTLYLLTIIILNLLITRIMATNAIKQLIRKVPEVKLGVSEPNPAWFGNPGNEPKNPSWTNKNWLKSRFHFSFAEYSNPRNTGFGVLRVMNDDLVQPLRGFGEHPHRDVEICTYIVEGHLTHKDSMGTEETLNRGSVQFMTAGRGVYHSEHNLHDSEPLRFIQIWLNTRQRGLKPNYGSLIGNAERRRNQWAHLVRDVQSDPATVDTENTIGINCDANIFVAEIDANHDQPVEMTLAAGRQGYLLCMEGGASIRMTGGEDTAQSFEERLDRHDAAELFGPATLAVKPTSGQDKVHVLLVEMAYTGPGRTDL